jgi:excisionase family DNA binding protein
MQPASDKAGVTEQGDGAIKDNPSEEATGLNDDWITVTEAASLLGKHHGTVSRWATAGKLKSNKKKGKDRRILKSSVLLLKNKRECEDVLQDAAEDLRDRANKIPNMH